jgi:hypothetical protein
MFGAHYLDNFRVFTLERISDSSLQSIGKLIQGLICTLLDIMQISTKDFRSVNLLEA